MTHRVLTWAIAISTGIHLAVLLPMLSDQQTIVIYSPTPPSSSMTLVVSPLTHAEKQNAVTQARQQPAQAATQAKTTINQSQDVTPKNISATAADEKVEMPSPAQTQSSATRTDPQSDFEHDVINYLHAEFRIRFQYPLLARKRGWSGEVVIALNVDHNGLIDEIAIQKSSGYPVLDNNAVQTFRAIGTVTPAIQSRINSRQHLAIPVVYTLTGG